MRRPSQRQDLQEKLNVLTLRHAVLLQRAAILADYLRENITHARLSIVEKKALEVLIETTEKNLDFVKERRRKLIVELVNLSDG